MTSLLEMFKEAALRIGFSSQFKSISDQNSTLDPAVLQKRLLLCLFALGTNAGIKRLSASEVGEEYLDLMYVRQRYVTREALQNAIAQVCNALFEIRMASVWGEATTTCASDSKHFPASNQNLLTRWHARYRASGVTIYWHVEKHSACIFSQLRSCASSEVSSMINGAKHLGRTLGFTLPPQASRERQQSVRAHGCRAVYARTNVGFELKVQASLLAAVVMQ